MIAFSILNIKYFELAATPSKLAYMLEKNNVGKLVQCRFL